MLRDSGKKYFALIRVDLRVLIVQVVIIILLSLLLLAVVVIIITVVTGLLLELVFVWYLVLVCLLGV